MTRVQDTTCPYDTIVLYTSKIGVLASYSLMLRTFVDLKKVVGEG
jgi:hypothetical protein